MRRTHKAVTILTTLALTALSALTGAPAAANQFIDTRITFTIGDDNFLKNGGQSFPNSPTLGLDDRSNYNLPFDNLDSATTGRENQLHLVLYKRVEGILPGLITEAAAALELNMEALAMGESVGRVISDDSSYIRLAYALDELRKGKEYIDIVLFPLDGDRFRVGYLYDLTWGGTDMFPKKKGLSPAFKIGGNHGKFYWWAGMKMVQAEQTPVTVGNEQGTESQAADYDMVYSALAGVGAQPVEGLSIDLSGGYVQQAWNRTEDVLGARVNATGFSARVGYGRGMKVGLSSDLKLLRNDPEYLERFGRKPLYKNDDTVNWKVSAEGSMVAQTLADPDVFGGTKNQWASAAALDFRMQRNYLRLNVAAVYRSLEFNLLNDLGFPTYQAIPEDAIIMPQIFAAISADYHFRSIWLTPGIQAGVELPAAVKSELWATTSGSNAPATLIGEHTMLMRNRWQGDREVLPEGEGRNPVYSVRITAQWFPSEMLTMMAFLMLQYDENTTTLEINADLTKSRVYDEPVKFGAGITAQARF